MMLSQVYECKGAVFGASYQTGAKGGREVELVNEIFKTRQELKRFIDTNKDKFVKLSPVQLNIG